MNTKIDKPEIPFSVGEWLIDTKNPSNPGWYTGRWREVGNNIVMLQLVFPGGDASYRPMSLLKSMSSTGDSIEEKLKNGDFGKLDDIRRLITYEKLKGTLHEVIYSMESAQIDFYPYQFKPVLKFINAPTERLIIADEVGLGKTIESALIWMELQARRQARRLLVVCPRTLANKWKEELKSKFFLHSRIVNYQGLKEEFEDLKRFGPSHSFGLIASYTSLRPPKQELALLKESPEVDDSVSDKTKLLREIKHWSKEYFPFDLVIFDEAHYMRNPATTNFHLGEALSNTAGAVLCVSATPVNNSNTDLHSLLRLIDEDFFETQSMFEELLEANRPTVQASNALARDPVDIDQLESAIIGMKENNFINNSQLFKQFLERLESLDPENKSQVEKCQYIAEKLNLLGSYVNRTRRVQVQENRALREPRVLTVEYSNQEMALYQAILSMVRKMCLRDNRPFHIFQVMGLQLRAASCLPVIAQEIRSGKFGDIEELISESIGALNNDNFEIENINSIDGNELDYLLSYDYESNDSKYSKLKELINGSNANEKILIFAYYRPTLEYLRKRLVADDWMVTSIHGGLDNEQRWQELERFKDPHGPKIMLSSEVGSEGIDLQFCRVMVNYDLPWNPMRLEQRIGRIDRVGQKSKNLIIVNFKVKGTIEERLYEKLHDKLVKFKNSIGDIESMIGDIIKELSKELLSQELTPEQESKVIARSQRAIEQKLLQTQELEESGDALLALSDYVQNRVQEDRGLGRYIQPTELEDYLIDFFERNFKGCEIYHNTPVTGCFTINLTPEAQSSLAAFIKDDRSSNTSQFKKKQLKITFRRELYQDLSSNIKKTVNFVNHLSPLIKWITHLNKQASYSIYNVSALELTDEFLPEGLYCYTIEKWRLIGLSTQEKLAYGIISIKNNQHTIVENAETIIQNILRYGKDWTYPELEVSNVLNSYKNLEHVLAQRFDEAVTEFQAENENTYMIKAQRVRNFFDRKISQDQKRIESLYQANRREHIINMAKKRLSNNQENKEKRLLDLEQKSTPDFEQKPIAAGICKVISNK